MFKFASKGIKNLITLNTNEILKLIENQVTKNLILKTLNLLNFSYQNLYS